MTTFNDKIKKDEKIMAVLGITEIRHLIAHTSKGELSLLLRKDSKEYIFVLDAVPVDKDVNKELMDLLFPVKAQEIPQVKKTDTIVEIDTRHSATGKPLNISHLMDIGSDKGLQDEKGNIVPFNKIIQAKPRGRPKGIKNK